MIENQNSYWEFGSEFHWIEWLDEGASDHPWKSIGNLWGTGRDALRALLNYGAKSRGWRRLWLPSYFCQEVVHSVSSTGVDILFYQDSPVTSKKHQIANNTTLFSESKYGDVILSVNYFGLRSASSINIVQSKGVEIVEDHTHDPWSSWAFNSTASYCIASLRKTLPIPDGGVLWSPLGFELPNQRPVTLERELAAGRKRSAMLLKKLYLQGKNIDKNRFRRLQLTGEEKIASGEISGITSTTSALLDIMPIAHWRDVRKRNYNYFLDRTLGIGHFDVLHAADSSCFPFSFFIVTETPTEREKIRERLISNRVYPSVLWPLDKPFFPDVVCAEDLCLSRTILSIHCDMRYSMSDMKIVADLLNC